MAGRRTTPTPFEDPRVFWDHVLIGDGCWEWQAGRTNRGYGRVMINRKNWGTHRLAWALWHGTPPPDDLLVCHHCDNRICCRPDHLFLGTSKDNIDDAKQKGRMRGKWTHCKVGHPLEGANLYVHPSTGARACWACIEERGRRRTERKRAERVQEPLPVRTCIICGKEWSSVRPGSYCSNECWKVGYRQGIRQYRTQRGGPAQ